MANHLWAAPSELAKLYFYRMRSALPTPPTWMERDIVRVRSPDQEHNKMTPVRAQIRIGPLDSESSEVQRHPKRRNKNVT